MNNIIFKSASFFNARRKGYDERMNNQKTKKRLTDWLFPILTAFSSLLAVLAVLLDFEILTNYFRAGAILPMAATVFALLAAATGTVLSLSTKRSDIAATPFVATKAPSKILYGFVISAFLLLANGVNATTVLMVLTLALCAVYAFYTGNGYTQKDAGTTAFYGFATVLAPIFFCALFYFDNSIEINAPMKTAIILSLLCCMIYFTGELRFLLNRPMKKLFLVLAYLTAAISIPASLAIFTSVARSIAYTFTEFPELSILSLIKAQKLEYVSAAVMVLLTALHALSKVKILLSDENQEEQDPNQEESAEASEQDDQAASSVEKEQTKQPLPWEVDIDIDSLNRKE